MRPNPGHLPNDTVVIDPESGRTVRYRKVHVRLVNGWTSLGGDPWPAAGGKPPTQWTRTGHRFDIAEYEPAD